MSLSPLAGVIIPLAGVSSCPSPSTQQASSFDIPLPGRFHSNLAGVIPGVSSPSLDHCDPQDRYIHPHPPGKCHHTPPARSLPSLCQCHAPGNMDSPPPVGVITLPRQVSSPSSPARCHHPPPPPGVITLPPPGVITLPRQVSSPSPTTNRCHHPPPSGVITPPPGVITLPPPGVIPSPRQVSSPSPARCHHPPPARCCVCVCVVETPPLCHCQFGSASSDTPLRRALRREANVALPPI